MHSSVYTCICVVSSNPILVEAAKCLYFAVTSSSINILEVNPTMHLKGNMTSGFNNYRILFLISVLFFFYIQYKMDIGLFSKIYKKER